MAFNCKAMVRLKARLNILGYYWRSVLNSFICAEEPRVFGWAFLVLLILRPQHEQCLWEVFVGQETLGCNVAVGILHHLQKLLLSAVSFPAAFRARFLCLSCDEYLLDLFLRDVSITWLFVQVCTRYCSSVTWHGEWRFAQRGVGGIGMHLQSQVSTCEYPILVLLEEQSYPCPSSGASLLVRCRGKYCISLFPLQDFWLCIVLLCLTLYSNLGL